MEDFKPRKFKALVDEFGLDDVGMSGLTFKVQSIKRGKTYEESNPIGLSGNPKGVVIDDNGCWWHSNDKNFKERFKEINNE